MEGLKGNRATRGAHLDGHLSARFNARQDRGTALLYAIQKGHTEVVRLLLDKGSKVDVATPVDPRVNVPRLMLASNWRTFSCYFLLAAAPSPLLQYLNICPPIPYLG
jgi:hypothetical protein